MKRTFVKPLRTMRSGKIHQSKGKNTSNITPVIV